MARPEELSVDFDLTTIERPRPIGISILAVLNLLGGLALLVMIPLILSKREAISSTLTGLGIPPVLALVILCLHIVLDFYAGLGMLAGSSRGWELGMFVSLWGIARDVNVLVMLSGLELPTVQMQRILQQKILQAQVGIPISLLILVYFMSNGVLDYFQISRRHGLRVMAVESVVLLLGLGSLILLQRFNFN
jgi:hypothetical protein